MQGTSGDGVGSLQVCQAIVPDLDWMTAKLVLTARRTVFCSKGIADHDAVIPSLCRKEIVKCCKVGVASIADHLAVDISDTKGSTHKARLAMMEWCHAVKHMSHGCSAVGDAHHRLLIGCGRMTHADHHACFLAVSGQCKLRVMLRCQCDIADQAIGRFLVHLELLHRRYGDRFRRLRSLVLHIQIWSLKMNT